MEGPEVGRTRHSCGPGPIRASAQTHPPSSARGGVRAQRCPAALPAARHSPAGPHGARPAHRHLHPLALPSPCPSPLCPRDPAGPWKPNPAAGPPQAPRAVPARPPRPLAPLLRPHRAAAPAPPLRRRPPPIGCGDCHSSASPTLLRAAPPPADAMAGGGGRVTRAGWGLSGFRHFRGARPAGTGMLPQKSGLFSGVQRADNDTVE